MYKRKYWHADKQALIKGQSEVLIFDDTCYLEKTNMSGTIRQHSYGDIHPHPSITRGFHVARAEVLIWKTNGEISGSFMEAMAIGWICLWLIWIWTWSLNHLASMLYYQEKYEASVVEYYVKAFLYAKRDIMWFSINKEIKLERILVCVDLLLFVV